MNRIARRDGVDLATGALFIDFQGIEVNRDILVIFRIRAFRGPQVLRGGALIIDVNGQRAKKTGHVGPVVVGPRRDGAGHVHLKGQLKPGIGRQGPLPPLRTGVPVGRIDHQGPRDRGTAGIVAVHEGCGTADKGEARGQKILDAHLGHIAVGDVFNSNRISCLAALGDLIESGGHIFVDGDGSHINKSAVKGREDLATPKAASHGLGPGFVGADRRGGTGLDIEGNGQFLIGQHIQTVEDAVCPLQDLQAATGIGHRVGRTTGNGRTIG